MALVYADHPYPLIKTPVFKHKQDGIESDIYDTVASQMGLVHNAIICGLNSIHLQAPHIQPKDQKSFVSYMLQWRNCLAMHHGGEESYFFPEIEKRTGANGIMDANVAQHHAFETGLEAFTAYLKDVEKGDQKYDGNAIVALLDGFGPLLTEHLADEIPTLQGLRDYKDMKPDEFEELFEEEGQKTMGALGLSGLSFFLASQDLHYEEGIWASFPPAPGVVKFLCRSVVWWLNRDVLRFGACDRLGNMKPLYTAE